MKNILTLTMYLMAGTIGWNVASFWKEYQLLKVKVVDINMFCITNASRFNCNIQVLPNGRKIIYVSEKK